MLQEYFKNIISIANDLNIPQILNNSQVFYSHQSCQGPALAGASLDHKVRALADLTSLPQFLKSKPMVKLKKSFSVS